MGIEVGQFVIINETDRPCAWLTCVVIGIGGDHVHTMYLCDTPEFDKYNKRGCINSVSSVTSLDAFGVELTVDGEFYSCKQVRPSVARYKDGDRREWQDCNPTARWPLRKNLLSEVAETKSLESETWLSTSIATNS